MFADPEDLDLDVDDDDGDIDSDDALGDSDLEKFKDFTFRGSSKPRALNRKKRRPTATDFMSDSEDEDIEIDKNMSDDAETDEDILDVDQQHQTEDGAVDVNSDEMDNSSDAESLGNESVEEHMHESEDESAPSEEEEEGDNGSEDEEGEKARRVELRKIMSEEHKTVVATISQAARADAAKGNAVKEQRKAFDSFLGSRMILQKALVATNSMAVVEEKDFDESANQPYEAAEEAAIKLWNTLDEIRHQLSKATSATKTGQKRKRGVDISTPSSTLWERLQTSEVAVIDNRQQTLEKWSAKVRGSTSLPLSSKLNPTALQQSITSVLQDQLASSDHLVRRTKIPRSCAPVQRDLKLAEDPNIYDDANFYQLLLKELVDQRRIESLSAPAAGAGAGKAMQWTAIKEAKTRKNVDTKASKGRKMRYTVHEKLQNFMAPENRGKWEPDAIDRFFGTLLGQKITLAEADVEDDEEENRVPLEEEGLMLFRS
jgi:protein AATF/BFR2